VAKPRVRMQPTRTAVADTQAVKMLNPDAWREGLTTAQRGYGGKWQRYRAAYLAKHPLCVACEAEGKVVVATVLDHIEPHRGNMEIFWRPGNVQGLCAHHHGLKGIEEGGIGEARRG
jgi:5-methylcytosine-specific restriction protein A